MSDDIRLVKPNLPPVDPAEYETWFRSEVEAGLQEANDPYVTLLSHVEVTSELEKLRKNWRERAAAQRHVA